MSDIKIQRVPIPGYEGSYWVTNQGDVLSKFKKLKLYLESSGYLQVSLCKGGKAHKYRVHRLVLLSFKGPAPHACEGCHNNGIKSDNRLTNLRWDTKSSNGFDKRLHGVIAPKGTQRPGSKLTEEQALKIRNDKGSLRVIAAEYGVHCTTILAIKKGRTWSHVQELPA